MKRTTILLTLISLIITPFAASADQVVVTLNPSSTVTTDYVMLGSIATISPSPLDSKYSAKIAATIVGRSPLPGLSRPLTRGDVKLKLRVNGIDPSTIDFEGAQQVTVATAGTAQSPAGGQAQSAAESNGQATIQTPSVKAVKYGDAVDIVVVDGPVTVHARGYANQNGALGDTIQVRRDGLDHLLTCIVIDAGQVQLEE